MVLQIHRGGLDADGVAAALRCAAPRQRLESNMPAAVTPRDQIVIAGLRHPAVTVGVEELRQVAVLLSVEVDRSLLHVRLRLGLLSEGRRAVDGLLGGDEVMIEQHAGG
ncbi:MAG: hypothetical protein ACK55I_04540, partial [bacterium]